MFCPRAGCGRSASIVDDNVIRLRSPDEKKFDTLGLPVEKREAQLGSFLLGRLYRFSFIGDNRRGVERAGCYHANMPEQPRPTAPSDEHTYLLSVDVREQPRPDAAVRSTQVKEIPNDEPLAPGREQPRPDAANDQQYVEFETNLRRERQRSRF
jgi:hypothetical protein